MADELHELGVYLQLAQASLRRRRPFFRDKMLVLAATTAANMQVDTLADYCRREILQHNPRHLVGRWASMEEALIDTEFLVFLRQIRRRYPLERSERLLEAMGILSAEAADSADVLEYAADILGIDVARLRAS